MFHWKQCYKQMNVSTIAIKQSFFNCFIVGVYLICCFTFQQPNANETYLEYSHTSAKFAYIILYIRPWATLSACVCRLQCVNVRSKTFLFRFRLQKYYKGKISGYFNTI